MCHLIPPSDGGNDLLPMGRLIEQLYHKSFDSVVRLILNWCNTWSNVDEHLSLAGIRGCLFEQPMKKCR